MIDGQHMGDVVGDEKCPRCGAPVIYNGNYFCATVAHGEDCWIHIPPGEKDHDPVESARLLAKLQEARGGRG